MGFMGERENNSKISMPWGVLVHTVLFSTKRHYCTPKQPAKNNSNNNNNKSNSKIKHVNLV